MQPRKDPIARLDYSAVAPPGSRRTTTALALAVPLGAAAGLAASLGGYGFLCVWLFFSVACPLALCFVATSRYVLVAVVPAASMTASLLVCAGISSMNRSTQGLRSGFTELAVVTGGLGLVSLLIAFVIGSAFAVDRRSDAGPRALPARSIEEQISERNQSRPR